MGGTVVVVGEAVTGDTEGNDLTGDSEGDDVFFVPFIDLELFD